MKKIFTLFIALALLTSVFAQNNIEQINVSQLSAGNKINSSSNTLGASQSLNGLGGAISLTNCSPVSITPAGPISIGKGQGITFDAGSGHSTYSWLTNGTPRSIHFGITGIQAGVRSNLIMTDGFLPLQKDDGSIVYTTDGRFTIDANGTLIHKASGFPLNPQMVIPNNADLIIINADGVVQVSTPGNVNYIQIGQLNKVTFMNWQGLDTLGENLYGETMNSGSPIYSTPGQGITYPGWSQEANTQTVNFSGSNLLYDQLNLSIAGNGYFQLQTPDGNIVYTRDGALTINTNGQVIHKATGYMLQPQITVPQNAKFASITTEGNVQIVMDGSNDMQIGQIQLALFNNPSGLDSTSIDGGIYMATDQSGTPIVTMPGNQGAGLFIHNFYLTVIVTDANGCEGTSTVMFSQYPYPKTPTCATDVSITPAGPISIGSGQGITFDAGSGKSTYSWLTNGTPRSIHFSITGVQAGVRSNLIMTDGFLSLQKDDGSIVYTTDGRFTIDANGTLIHKASGFPLNPQMVIPNNADKIIIGENGIVQVSTPGNVNYSQIGQLNKVTFMNWQGLDTLGENLYCETMNSGSPNYSTPGQGINYPGWSQEANTQTVNFSGSNLLYDQLNLGIAGNGYFQLQTPDGNIVYTKDGAFTINTNGQVIHKATGYILQPQITVPQYAKFANITTEGNILIVMDGSNDMQIGQIQLALFNNPSELDSTSIGGGIYIATDQSGNPIITNPGTMGAGLFIHNFYLTVIATDANDCEGRSTVMFSQYPYPKTPTCATDVSITPAGPISIGSGQGITFDAGSGKITYSWLTKGTPMTIHFSISGVQAGVRSNLIMTDGFLSLQKDDGSIIYTTDGRFTIDSNGTLIHKASGFPLNPQMTIPNNTDSIIISNNGIIQVLTQGSYSQIGQINKVSFMNWQGLDTLGENLYRETVNSGSPIYNTPEAKSSLTGWTKEVNTQTVNFSGSNLLYDQLNLSIVGKGYFQLQKPDGTIAYTRDGAFTINTNGQIMHKLTGFMLLPQITFPQNTNFASISADGFVKGIMVYAGIFDTIQLGQIQIAFFANPAGSDSVFGDYYQATMNSGIPIITTPGSMGAGLLIHNFYLSVMLTDANGCKGTSSVLISQYPNIATKTPTCTTNVSISPAGPISTGKGQGITFDAGSGHSNYSWLTKGTPRSIHFGITGLQAVVQSNLNMTDGFLPLQKDDGTTVYTTDGRFTTDVNGTIVHQASGFPLNPQMVIPNNTDSIIISNNGIIQVLTQGNYNQIGQINKVTFMNWQGLDTLGENLYRETMNSGSPIYSTPEQEITYPGWSQEANTQTVNFSGSNLLYDQLNLSIAGKGYFQLQKPDGTIAYTRDGVFTINSNGEVIHKSTGYILQPQITIPQNSKFVNITTEGNVQVVMDGSNNMQIGQLQLALFNNSSGLDSTSINDVYLLTEQSGSPMVTAPGNQGAGLFIHNFYLTAIVTDANGCQGTSTVLFCQYPYPKIPSCATDLSITPAGPISTGKGQGVLFDAGNSHSTYSWLTKGTPKTVHFTINNIQAGVQSNLNMTDGFLPLQKDDGTTVYTTDGRFTTDVNGNLIHQATGFPLNPQMTIPNNIDSVIISENGVIQVLTQGSYSQIGQLNKITFMNWQGLDTLGENLYRETMNSGMAISSTPEAESSYSGWIKEANTQMVNFSGSNLLYDQLNLSIAGKGYFQLQKPDGTIAYTRDGAFTINANGQVIHKSTGYMLLPQITIPQNAKFANISTEGNIQVTMWGMNQQIGQLQLALFNNSSGLDSTSINDVYLLTEQSGSPMVTTPGNQGAGLLIHNFYLSVIVTDANGCEGTSTVMFSQYPYPKAPTCATEVSITPTGPISLCEGQSKTFDAGSSHSTYSWLTNGTPRTVRFTINNIQAGVQSNLNMTDGFLPLQKDDGTTVYTTDGRFTTDINGTIVHQSTGFPLTPQMSIPNNTDSIIISNNGIIQVLTQGNYNQIGQINKVSFMNWQGLDTLGENLYSETMNSGSPIYNTPVAESSYSGWTKEANTQTVNFSGSNLVYDQLNLGIAGNGYFQLQTPNGNIVYTRDGAFTINSNGQVIHQPTGYILQPQITIPQNAKFANISADGIVKGIMVYTGVLDTSQLGQIQIALFNNPSGLDSTSIEGIYMTTSASGYPMIITPGDQGAGVLIHNFYLSVIATDANECEGRSTVMVTQYPSPIAPVISMNGSTSFCKGGSLTLDAGSYPNALHYLWSSGDTTQQMTTDTSGHFTVKIKNMFGCISYSDTVISHVLEPKISPSGTVNICQGGQVTLTANTADSYLWSTGETTQTITVADTGAYNVTETFNNIVCSLNPGNSVVRIISPGEITKTSVNSADWNSPSTWGDAVPLPCENVVIANDVTIIAGAKVSCVSLTINDSKTLNSTSDSLNISGNFTNNGLFNHNNGTVVFSGSDTISGSATTTFNKITIAGTLTGHAANMNIAGNLTNNGTFNHNNGKVTFNGNTTLSGTTTTTTFNNVDVAPGKLLTIDAGGKIMQVSNQIYIKATDPHNMGQLAIADNSSRLTGTGGQDTVYVQIYDTLNNWHYQAVPMYNGYKGAMVLHYFYGMRFVETANAYTSITGFDSLQTGRGYAIKFNNSILNNIARLTTFKSPLSQLHTGTITYPVTYSKGSGWNLVGNPYPSSIDWEAANGWHSANIEPTIYTYDAIQKRYVTYNKYTHSSTNGGTRYIPPMQGFYVHCTAAGQWSMDNRVRIAYNQSLWKGEEENTSPITNQLNLIVTGNGYSDESVIAFASNAPLSFNGNYDTYKLFSPEAKVPQINTTTLEGIETNLAVYYLPSSLMNGVSVPLDFTVGARGVYTISASSLNLSNTSVEVTLEDLKTKTNTNLRTSLYTFSSDSVADNKRFMVHFGNTTVNAVNDIKDDENAINIYSNNDIIYVQNDLTVEKGMIYVYDLQGKAIVNQKLESNALNKIKLNSVDGVYLVKVFADNTIYTKKLFIRKYAVVNKINPDTDVSGDYIDIIDDNLILDNK